MTGGRSGGKHRHYIFSVHIKCDSPLFLRTGACCALGDVGFDSNVSRRLDHALLIALLVRFAPGIVGYTSARISHRWLMSDRYERRRGLRWEVQRRQRGAGLRVCKGHALHYCLHCQIALVGDSTCSHRALDISGCAGQTMGIEV